MARIITRRKTKTSYKEKLERKDRYRVIGYKGWIDPYPHIGGTLPEKKVYAFLMQIGIPFQFQTWFHAVVQSSPNLDPEYDNWLRPDFIIPSLKIIIEVDGIYWHSLDGRYEDDALKTYIYEHYLGWKVIRWFDVQIEYEGVHKLALEEPRLYSYVGPHVGEVITEHKEYRDDSAGIRTINRNRKDYALHAPKIKTNSTRKKSVISYDTRR